MGRRHSSEEYFKKKEEQLQRCPPGSYDVVLKAAGIAHPSFSDIPLLFAGEQGYPETRVVLHNLDLIQTFVREFLDKNFRQKEAPLLDGSLPLIRKRPYIVTGSETICRVFWVGPNKLVLVIC